MLPGWARVNLGAMAMKAYSAFPKAPALLEPHHKIVWCYIQSHSLGGVLLLCRDAVSDFYSPSLLGCLKIGYVIKLSIFLKHPVHLNMIIKQFFYTILFFILYPQAILINLDQTGVCPRSVMVKAMDCGIVVHKFILQLRYYVHFQTNTLGNGMNPLILPAMG